MIMDIGKSLAGFILVVIGLQLIDGVMGLINQGLPGLPFLLNGLLAAAFGSYFARQFWRHDDDIRRWTIITCKFAYVIVPVIILFVLLTGGPMTINAPFLHTKTDSPPVVSCLGLGCMLYFIALHFMLASPKAIAEFTSQNNPPSNS